MNEASPLENLDVLRARVARLDREILEKVAERLETSKSIGEAKRRAGLPIRDFRVEAEVMRRARGAAGDLGFDPALAESVLESLIEAAVRTQADLRPPSGGEARCQRILILGGAGRMGGWLRQFLAGQGHQVAACDPGAGAEFASLEAAAGEHWDTVILSTPLAQLPEALQQALSLPGKPLIFDIGSLKSHLVEPLRAATAAGHQVASLHPMFAPGTATLTGRTVLVCDAGNPQATEAACDLFRDTAVSLSEVQLEQHDHVMGALLGLSHSINLLFGKALCGMGLTFTQLGPIASTTFAKQARTAAEVAAENAELYYGIQHFNVRTPEVYAALQSALDEWKAAAAQDSSAEFERLMGQCHDFFYPEPARAKI